MMPKSDVNPVNDLVSGNERFPGWRVVAGCFVVLTTTSGFGFYGLSVYLNALSDERGWNVASISFATTVFFVVSGVVGLVVARLIAQYDVRTVMTVGAVVGGVALSSLGRITAEWQLFIVYAVFAVGFAGAGLVPATTVVTRWFHAKRSVALAVASTGLSAGGILITPGVKWFLDRRGLAAGTPLLGVLFVVGIVPATWWLIHPNPAAMGWLPDGVRSTPGDAKPAAATGTPFAVAHRSKFFIATSVAYILVLAAQVGGIQQLVKLVSERIDAHAATFATLALALTSVIARLIGGQVLKRSNMLGIAASMAALQGVALALLSQAHHTGPLFAGIVMFGGTIGNLLMLQPLLIAERFGVRDYARIFARAQFYSLIGTAGGPWLLGWLHDLRHNYTLAYGVAAVLSLSGAAVMASAGHMRDADDAPAER